jgi:2,5-furandicarboxylate decarboxylase 1
VVGGLYGTPERVKRILTSDYQKFPLTNVDAVARYAFCSNINEGDSLWDHFIVNAEPECRDVVKTGNDVNLHSLPICTHNEHDKGRFITAGVQVVEWIDGKTLGLGIHRMCMIDQNHLSCLAPINRRVGLPHYKSQEGVPMAVVIGAPPEVVLASQAKVNQRTQKYIVASQIGRMNGTGKIKLTRCLNSDLYVPADAELVLECRTIPGSQYDDTPFAEYPGTYSLRSTAFTVKVEAITHRKDYLYQTILTGMPPQEDSNLCGIPYAAELHRVASGIVEEVTDISTFLGNGVFSCLICVKKNSDTEITNLLYALLGNRYVKSVAVMDSDLKATERDFRFAFDTRYQPDTDTVITPPALGASLDPSSPVFQATSKIGMDLTVPRGSHPNEYAHNIKKHMPVKPHKDYLVEARFWE